MTLGMSRMAEKTSVKGVSRFRGLERMCSSSSGVGGISGVVRILHHTEAMEQNEPSRKEAKTQLGILPVWPAITIGKMKSEKLANVWPSPVKKLCA